MIPTPTVKTSNEIEILKAEIQSLKEDIIKFKQIIQSIKPLRSIYMERPSGDWNRHYHYNDDFIERHLQKLNFKDDGNIGFIFTQDPNSILYKRRKK